ncbi:hypothetical protein [Arachidicoccus sp.]|uniref:hypothetical protein n=1 Tax=Arachidicoccus sp. TaxID=1872624 RepID=UPI003D1CB261
MSIYERLLFFFATDRKSKKGYNASNTSLSFITKQHASWWKFSQLRLVQMHPWTPKFTGRGGIHSNYILWL